METNPNKKPTRKNFGKFSKSNKFVIILSILFGGALFTLNDMNMNDKIQTAINNNNTYITQEINKEITKVNRYNDQDEPSFDNILDSVITTQITEMSSSGIVYANTYLIKYFEGKIISKDLVESYKVMVEKHN